MKSQALRHIVMDHHELARRVREHQADGRTVVWANGAFDVLHVGHIRFLEGAAAEGDILVVGVNADESIRAYKGPDRPVNKLAERMELVAAFRAADYVTSFSEPTCDRMLELLRPDVHAKGPDERTPDISSIIQEIVDQNGWTGSAIVLMFRDNPAKPSQGTREAESFDGDASEAPLLHISYQ